MEPPPSSCGGRVGERVGCMRRATACRPISRGQCEIERGAFAWLGIQPDAAAVPLNDLLYDRQARAGAAAIGAAGVQSFEDLEHVLPMLRSDADAIVANVESGRRPT